MAVRSATSADLPVQNTNIQLLYDASRFARSLSGILARLSRMSDCEADWYERESKLRDRRLADSFHRGGNRPFFGIMGRKHRVHVETRYRWKETRSNYVDHEFGNDPAIDRRRICAMIEEAGQIFKRFMYEDDFEKYAVAYV